LKHPFPKDPKLEEVEFQVKESSKQVTIGSNQLHYQLYSQSSVEKEIFWKLTGKIDELIVIN